MGYSGYGNGMFDPWGNPSYYPLENLAAWNYYRWGGGWGYMKFDALGLYYVHGRWYSPAYGRFLSRDASRD